MIRPAPFHSGRGASPPQRFRDGILLGLASGVLLVLSLPKFNVYSLAWLALVPLFAAVSMSSSYRHAAAASYAAGVVYFAGTCYWMADTMVIFGGLPYGAAAAVALLFVSVFAGYFAAFGLALNFFARTPFGWFAAPMLWTLLEYVRTYVPFGGFPWMLSGYALVPYAGVLQIAAWTGVYGLSFVMAAVNALIAAGVHRRSRRVLLAAAALLVGLRLFPIVGQAGPPPALPVTIVQPNLENGRSWEPVEFEALLEDLRRLSSGSGRSRLIAWPETPGPFFLDRDPAFRGAAETVARENDAYLLAGYIGFTDDSPTNSAALLDPGGNTVSRYDKIHLVPFGEYVPMRSFLGFAEGLLEEVGGFAPGARYTISSLDGHSIATVICFESIFPSLVRRFVQDGAELLVVITNDGWFGQSSAPYQHLRMGIVRAVENGRYMIRSANTGISAIIDPSGRVLDSTPLNVRTALSGVAGFRRERTFYTMYGDVFVYLNAAVMAAALAWRAVQRRQPGEKHDVR